MEEADHYPRSLPLQFTLGSLTSQNGAACTGPLKLRSKKHNNKLASFYRGRPKEHIRDLKHEDAVKKTRWSTEITPFKWNRD